MELISSVFEIYLFKFSRYLFKFIKVITIFKCPKENCQRKGK